MIEQKRVVEDATFQIACAMQHIDWLRSVLSVLRDRLDEQEANAAYANVAELAIYNAEDWHNQLDCERESLEKRTDQAFNPELCAPQNAALLIRGAIGAGSSLAERITWARSYASLSQLSLAQTIGVKQSAISYLESGQTNRTGYLPEIACACGVDISWLAFGVEGAQ